MPSGYQAGVAPSLRQRSEQTGLPVLNMLLGQRFVLKQTWCNAKAAIAGFSPVHDEV